MIRVHLPAAAHPCPPYPRLHVQKLWTGDGCGIVLNGKFEVSADVQAVMRAVDLGSDGLQRGASSLLSQKSTLARAFSLRG